MRSCFVESLFFAISKYVVCAEAEKELEVITHRYHTGDNSLN